MGTSSGSLVAEGDQRSVVWSDDGTILQRDWGGEVVDLAHDQAIHSPEDGVDPGEPDPAGAAMCKHIMTQ